MPRMSEEGLRSKDLRTGTYAGVQLQHRHFAFIASVLRYGIPTMTARQECCQAFINFLTKTNDKFNADRFRDAVGRISEMTQDDLQIQISTTAFWLDAMHQELLARKNP